MAARIALAGVIAITPGGPAGEALPGPIPARLVEAIDGDTIRVRAHIWLGQEVEIAVRLAGIDAPERRGKCPAERARAEAARAFVEARLGDRPLALRNIHYGKFAGRVVANLVVGTGEDLSQLLLAHGHARPYDGRARRLVRGVTVSRGGRRRRSPSRAGRPRSPARCRRSPPGPAIRRGPGSRSASRARAEAR